MRLPYLAVMVLVSAVMFGCAKKADTSKSIEQIQTEVQKMSVADLQSTAEAYVNAIKGKKTEVEKIQSKLSSLSPKDLLSQKAGEIKDQISKVSSELSELTKRYEVYANKFREMGGDISKIQI